jgi:hypothetical protein
LCQTQVKLLLEVFSFPIVARFQVVSCHYLNMYLLFMRSSIILLTSVCLTWGGFVSLLPLPQTFSVNSFYIKRLHMGQD